MDSSLLEQATEKHHAGDLPAALALYERILATDPSHAVAVFRIGVVAIQQGDFESATNHIRRAIALTPAVANFHRGLGQAAVQIGRHADAAAAYRAALDLEPDSPDDYFHLAHALQTGGDIAPAISAYQSCLKLNPDFADAWTNVGVALQSLGKMNEAFDALNAAIKLAPQNASFRLNLGSALCQHQQFALAVEVLETARALDPTSAEAAFNLGVAMYGTGRLTDAAAAYETAIALRPGYADALNNVGNVFKELGDFKRARESFGAALRARPGFAAAYNNLACLLRTLGQIGEAEAVLRNAISLDVQSAAIFNNLGNMLKDGGALDEAIESYRTAIALDPADPGCHGNLIYTLSFAETVGKKILEECRRWNDHHAAPLLQPREYPNDFSPDRRLRIGYVSGDFRDHCQSLFTIPLLANHDHDAFEVFCYSAVERPDDLTRRVTGYADTWRDIHRLDDAQAAQLIRDDKIDILIDLGMHMATSRPMIFARAPAPIQIAWLAYPGTTGIAAMDYRFTDPRLDPPGFDDQYTEQSIRLPDSFWCYDPLSETPVNSLPALDKKFITFGCLNNTCKLTDATLRMWAGVLHAVPNSRLMLLAPEGIPRTRLANRLSAVGISTSRVLFERFRPRSHYLSLYHQIDLGLDTFPYNGHTTSLDSFWMGVPVVTRVGQTAVGRGGFSQLFNLGLTQLAADTDTEFVRIAVDLANDLSRLTELRSTLRERMTASPLMDAKRFAAGFENACRELWKSRCDKPLF